MADPTAGETRSDADSLETTAWLLDRARQGDSGARERLFQRLLPVLRRWAQGRLPAHARDLAETDDLVQVTLVRALARLDAFESRGEGALLGYLRQILLNAVREEIRRSGRRGRRESLDGHDPVDPERAPLDEVLGREQVERYERALTQLQEDQRQAVLLRLEFGYSYAQIAEAMARPSADAARMLVVRALAHMARLLNDD